MRSGAGDLVACLRMWLQPTPGLRKRYLKRLAELIRLGARRDLAAPTVGSPCGPWRASSTPALHQALSNAYLASLGLVSVANGR